MENLIQYLKQQPRHGQRLGQNAPVPRGTGTAAATSTNEQVLALAQQLANEIVAEQQQAQILSRNGRVFTKNRYSNLFR